MTPLAATRSLDKLIFATLVGALIKNKTSANGKIINPKCDDVAALSCTNISYRSLCPFPLSKDRDIFSSQSDNFVIGSR